MASRLRLPLVGLSISGSSSLGYCMWMGPLAAAGYGSNTALGSCSALIWMFDVERQCSGGMNLSPFPSAPRPDVLLGAGKRVRHASDHRPSFGFVWCTIMSRCFFLNCSSSGYCCCAVLVQAILCILLLLIASFPFFYPVLLPLLPSFLPSFLLPRFCFFYIFLFCWCFFFLFILSLLFSSHCPFFSCYLFRCTSAAVFLPASSWFARADFCCVFWLLFVAAARAVAVVSDAVAAPALKV